MRLLVLLASLASAVALIVTPSSTALRAPKGSNAWVGRRAAVQQPYMLEIGSTAAPKIIIAGAPASGKGTQCELIKEKYGVVHLSTGDILRAAVSARTELGNQAKGFMDRGELVPDELMIGVVQDRLKQSDCQQQGWLLDGFPRTKAQADALAASGVAPDSFIVLDVPDELLVERVVGRRTDPVTGKIYHMTYFPPESPEVRARLVQRGDDTEEKIVVRIAAFKANCAAVEGCYKDVLVSLDGTREKEVVFQDISTALEAATASRAPAAVQVSSSTSSSPSTATVKATTASAADSSSSTGISSKPALPIPDGMPADKPSPFKAALSLAGFVAADRALAKGFAASGISFPSSLAGMVALFCTLLAAQARAPGVASSVVAAASPGAHFLSTWLPVFFVPSLVVLPLTPPIARPVLLRLTALILCGYALSLGSTASAVTALRGRLAAPADGRPALPVGATAAAVARTPSVLSTALLGRLASGAVLTLVAAALGSATKWAQPLSSVSMLCATLAAYVAGTRAPSKLKAVVHPLITCTAGALTWAAVQGAALKVPFRSVLGAYITRSRCPLHLGAGDILLGLLGPSILSFALQMFARRRLMKENAGPVLGGTLFAAVSGLFGTAAAARALNLPPALRLATVSRTITSPLAVAIATMLGADVSMAVALVVVTGVVGANYGARILDAFGVEDPVTRGLAQGASSHGLGTAAMANEPSAFAFAAIAMALTATFSTALVSIAPVREALVRVAFGAATGL